MALADQSLGTQEVVNLLVGSGGVVVQVDAVSSVGVDVGRESTGLGEDGLDAGRNGSRGVGGVGTGATTECDIILAIDHVHGTCEGTGRRQSGHGHEFTNGHWLLVLLGVGQDAFVEVAGAEEEELVGANVRVNQVSTAVAGARSRGASRGVVENGLLEVGTGKEDGHGGNAGGEPSEDKCIRKVRVHGGHGDSLGRAEGVSDVDNLGGLLDALQTALAHLAGQLGQSLDLKEGLDFVLRIAVGGLANSKSVVREGVVSPGQDVVHVGVVEVVVGQIPVSIDR